MNQFGITHDWPGLCALCYTEVAEFNGSTPNGVPIISKWKGNKGDMQVELSDGSKMRVSVCIKCIDNFKPEDEDKLMQSVIAGWRKECDILVADESKPEWDEEKKKNYLERYEKLNIVKDEKSCR